MTLAYRHRRALLIASAGLYAVAVLARVFVDRPTLGLEHIFFLAVALLGLASGPIVGAGGGVLAFLLGAGAAAVSHHIPHDDGFTTAVIVEGFTMTAVGAALGWFAAANRRLVHSLSTIAERDFLTGLANTRGYEAAVQRRLADGEPFALLLGDMDGLKRINDLHGHREGNAALKRLAETLRENVRDDDEIARVGGDEFIVLTTASSSGAAWGLAARLEAALADAGIRVTFGWAVFPSEGSDEATLYRTADRRLYARKFARNKSREREVPHATPDIVPSRLVVSLDEG